MEIKTSELRGVLNSLKPGLAGSRETVEQSGAFAFFDGMVYTYNDDISVAAPFDIGIDGAVNAKELLHLADKLTNEKAVVSMKEDELYVKCGRSRAGIRLDTEILMPLDSIQLNDIKWLRLPVGFKQAIKDALFSVGSDESVHILTGINCRINRVESTDNARASIRILPKINSLDFLLPASAAKALVNYDKIEKWGRTENWLHFKIDDAVFSCKAFDDEFPDLSPHFEVEGAEFEFPKNTQDILDKAAGFIENELDQDKIISIKLGAKGVMTIRAEGENGWFEESLRTKYKGEEIQFSINPQYLQKILSHIDTAILGDDKVLFTADNFKHIIALEG